MTKHHEPAQLPLRIQVGALIFARHIGLGSYNTQGQIAEGALAAADVFIDALKKEAERKMALAETEKIVRA